jgi:hypothetical protein
MTSMTQLAELHVREFVSRQRFHDELNAAEHAEKMNAARSRSSDANNWRQRAICSAGPLCLLDAVGQAEESWLELLEHAPRCEMPHASEPTTRTLELQQAF